MDTAIDRVEPNRKTADLHAGARSEYVDVLIVGAGISGLGAAYYLQEGCPRATYAIVEAREALGGTWDLFKHPGVRSDSDLYTFGYAFRPWRSEKAIADAASILAYLRETAAENQIDRKIRYRHKVVRADFSTADACWRVEVMRADTQERVVLRCRWLFGAAGYYRYEDRQGEEAPWLMPMDVVHDTKALRDEAADHADLHFAGTTRRAAAYPGVFSVAP